MQQYHSYLHMYSWVDLASITRVSGTIRIPRTLSPTISAWQRTSEGWNPR